MKKSKRCFYCEREFNKQVVQTIDHIIPLSKGGNNKPANKVPACARCNSFKGNKSLEAFTLFIEERFATQNFNKFRDGSLPTILKNVYWLRTKIAPYKNELIIPGFKPKVKNKRPVATNKLAITETPEQREKELQEVLAAFPKKVSTPLLLKKFAKKFPHAYELISDINPDLPRWIIDNLVLSDFSKTTNL